MPTFSLRTQFLKGCTAHSTAKHGLLRSPQTMVSTEAAIDSPFLGATATRWHRIGDKGCGGRWNLTKIGFLGVIGVP